MSGCLKILILAVFFSACGKTTAYKESENLNNRNVDPTQPSGENQQSSDAVAVNPSSVESLESQSSSEQTGTKDDKAIDEASDASDQKNSSEDLQIADPKPDFAVSCEELLGVEVDYINLAGEKNYLTVRLEKPIAVNVEGKFGRVTINVDADDKTEFAGFCLNVKGMNSRAHVTISSDVVINKVVYSGEGDKSNGFIELAFNAKINQLKSSVSGKESYLGVSANGVLGAAELANIKKNNRTSLNITEDGELSDFQVTLEGQDTSLSIRGEGKYTCEYEKVNVAGSKSSFTCG